MTVSRVQTGLQYVKVLPNRLARDTNRQILGTGKLVNGAGRMIGRRSTPPADEPAKPKGFDDFDLRLGDIMRGERATMGKSLLDVQRELKIKATYIAAIENADPTAFETQGFIAGYVRSYARYLSLDPEWAYGRFCEEGNFSTAHGMSPAASGTRSAKPEKTAAGKGRRDPFADPHALFVPRGEAFMSRVEPSAVGSSLVLLALIGVIGYGGWSVLQEIQKVQFAPVDQAPGVTSTLDTFEPGATQLADATDTTDFTAPSADALDRLYRPQALEVPVLVARDGPISTLDPASVGTLVAQLPEQNLTPNQPAPTSEPEEAPIQVVQADIPEVVLFAVRPSWVRVSAADGTVLFEKILDSGEQYVLPKTDDAPLLRAGNAGSVYFAVNGENFGPAGAGPSVVKNVALTPVDLKEAYQVADLTKDSDLASFVALAKAEPATPEVEPVPE